MKRVHYGYMDVCFSLTRDVDLTHEQLRIVKFEPEPGAFAKIVAFAGASRILNFFAFL